MLLRKTVARDKKKTKILLTAVAFRVVHETHERLGAGDLETAAAAVEEPAEGARQRLSVHLYTSLL
jgi:hypothetical protein